MTCWLFLIMAIIFNVMGNLFLRKYSSLAVIEGLGSYFSLWFILGGACFGLSLICYSKAMQVLPLTIAYPILVGVSVSMSAIGAIVIFKEAMFLAQALGLALIVSGIVIVSASR